MHGQAVAGHGALMSLLAPEDQSMKTVILLPSLPPHLDACLHLPWHLLKPRLKQPERTHGFIGPLLRPLTVPCSLAFGQSFPSQHLPWAESLWGRETAGVWHLGSCPLLTQGHRRAASMLASANSIFLLDSDLSILSDLDISLISEALA